MRFTLTPTPSNTATPSLTPSNTPSYTPTGTVCPGLTPTATRTPTMTQTMTQTITSTPTSTIQTTPTGTLPPTPTPTQTPCPICNRYVNNTFETLEIDYQSCEGTWYYNELIPANQGVCIIEGTGGGIDWELMDFQSYNCGSPCPPPPPCECYQVENTTAEAVNITYTPCGESETIVSVPGNGTLNFCVEPSTIIYPGVGLTYPILCGITCVYDGVDCTTCGCNSFQVLLNTLGAPAICFSEPITVYTAPGGSISTGSIIYQECGLIAPVAGYDYVIENVTGAQLYEINYSTGEIGAGTGTFPCTPSGDKSLMIYAKDVATSRATITMFYNVNSGGNINIPGATGTQLPADCTYIYTITGLTNGDVVTVGTSINCVMTGADGVIMTCPSSISSNIDYGYVMDAPSVQRINLTVDTSNIP